MSRQLYRLISLALAVAFAVVGLAFVLFPDHVIAFPRFRVEGEGADNRFFVILAGAYMVVVTSLAWSMYRRPQQRVYPLLLCQAKGASSLLSWALFVAHRPQPIYLANAILDGLLCVVALVMLRGLKEAP
jgi:hypothetical protein